MPVTPSWTQSSPALNVEYVAPSGAWFIPNNGSSVTYQWNAYKANGSGASVMNAILINRNVTTNTDQSTFSQSGVNGITYITSQGHNGSDVFAPAFKITSAPNGLPDHCIMTATYSGTTYSIDFIWRAGVWVAIPNSDDFLRRGGAWTSIVNDYEFRGGLWVPA